MGLGLANLGKKVLLIDADPQGSLSIALGVKEPDNLETTLVDVIEKIVNEEEISEDYGIIKYGDNADLLPANIELSAVEISLTSVMSREMILRTYIEQIREKYDFIIIDCMPSLGIVTVNALVCADSVLIPVQAAFLPVKGLQQLIKTIYTIRKRLNPALNIEGILLTMVDNRTNYAKEVSVEVNNAYGKTIPVFQMEIPLSVRVAESSSTGTSIYDYDPAGKASLAYRLLTEEIVKNHSEEVNKDGD